MIAPFNRRTVVRLPSGVSLLSNTGNGASYRVFNKDKKQSIEISAADELSFYVISPVRR